MVPTGRLLSPPLPQPVGVGGLSPAQGCPPGLETTPTGWGGKGWASGSLCFAFAGSWGWRGARLPLLLQPLTGPLSFSFWDTPHFTLHPPCPSLGGWVVSPRPLGLPPGTGDHPHRLGGWVWVGTAKRHCPHPHRQQPQALPAPHPHGWGVGRPSLGVSGNDPAAGSPTTTLLRLLLPLAVGHCPISAPACRTGCGLLMALSHCHR